jgi:hypothetical protein
MLALNQENYSYIQIPNFSDTSVLQNLTKYIKTFKTLNQARRLLKSIFNNFDTFVLINNLNNSKTIDQFLLNLEDITESNEELLETHILSQWHLYPLYYLVDKIEDWNMATQGLLTGLEAQLKHKNTLNDN